MARALPLLLTVLLLGAACGRAKDRTGDAPSPYIGRDSAFGPTFEVDSTGKVTPIRVKKPERR
ncbi:MAG: hypothetical protein ACKOCV_00470 [Gemmatimonadota bacterium]